MWLYRTMTDSLILLLTWIPNLSSSPRMRSAPQVRFSFTARLIQATRSSVNGGLPRFCCGFDLHLQKRLNSSRCQRNTVSGCTMINASFHVRSLLAQSTMRDRSRQVSFERLVCRWSMISC
jgi:hypothetical protein